MTQLGTRIKKGPDPLPTHDIIASSIPIGLLVRVINANQIDISWIDSTDNIAVAGYEIYDNGIFFDTSITNSFSDTNLLANSIHTYSIKSYDAVGNKSDFSNSVTAITLEDADTVPPSVPIDLIITSITTTQIDLKWSPSTDNAAISNYVIYDNNIQVGKVPRTSFNHIGLQAGSTHNYCIKAYDSNNNPSAGSVVVTVTTKFITTPEIIGPFNLVLTTGNLHAPVDSNRSYPLSDQENIGNWTINNNFSDDFDATSLDRQKWYDKMPYASQGADPLLLNPTINGLEFHMRLGPTIGPYKYRGSYIASMQSSKLLYGYVELSLKMGANYANNNAFMYNKTAIEWTEIDITEIFPLKSGKHGMNVHLWYSPTEKTHLSAQANFIPTDLKTFQNEFHVFGLEWKPDRIAWYLDGVLIREGVNTSWHQPLDLLIGIWDNHNWQDKLAPNLIGMTPMICKYVRVWQ